MRWVLQRKVFRTDGDRYEAGRGNGRMSVSFDRVRERWYFYGQHIGNSLWDGRSFETREEAQDAAEKAHAEVKS